MIRKLVGLRIAQLRHELGLSQLAFSSQIGMARTYFAEVETGVRNVSVRNLEKIASGLGVTLSEFFDSDIFDPLYRPANLADHPKPHVRYEGVQLPPSDEKRDE